MVWYGLCGLIDLNCGAGFAVGIIYDYMNSNKAIELLENGRAHAVVTQVVLLSGDGSAWFSFDGKEWEETDSRLIKKELEDNE